MDMDEILRRAREAQAKAMEMQRAMASVEAEGTSGGGLVRVTLSGKNELTRLAIDPSLMKESEREILEDLVVAAHADAKAKLDARLAEEMAKMAGSLGLPPGFGT
jgi:DNA-binding YbaB/EbfC family protein